LAVSSRHRRRDACAGSHGYGEAFVKKKAVVRPQVGILMGSESDRAVMEEGAKVLETYGIGCEVLVRSAHRTPDQTARYAKRAEARGIKVLIAGAGGAAHLAGALAAHSRVPVLGVPLGNSPLGGFDALLSTVQMPPGVPVGTLGVGSWGARNAAHLALRILALSDRRLAARLRRTPAARRR
jgi:phosphoribosylaminoimidazole carboxylase PurE protein